MIDLHCHTTASDGVITPSALVKQAIHEGLNVIAISDHDSVSGIGEAMQAAEGTGLRLIPAVELSVDFPSGDFHLLGYGIDHNNQLFLEQLAGLKSLRETRIPRIIERLRQAKIELTAGEVKAVSGDAAPGRPHVARALVKKGYAPDVNAAIIKYLVRGTPGYVPKEKIGLLPAFELIKSAGGWPVLAHPKSLACKDTGEFDQIMESCIGHGLIGLEVYATIHEDAEVELFADMARRHHLIATGGSDFHGDNGARLGYYGDFRIIPKICARSLIHVMGTK